jgi:hypothetical protein
MKSIPRLGAAAILSLAASAIGAVPTVDRLDAALGDSDMVAPLHPGHSPHSAARILDRRGTPDIRYATTSELPQSSHANVSAHRSLPAAANEDGMFLDKLGVDVPGPLSLALLGLGLLGLGLTRINGFD